MKIKLLAVDIDGTLVTTEKDISESTFSSIKKFIDLGGVFAIASGRPVNGTRRYVDELGLKEHGGYVISYNGSRIFNARTGELLYKKDLTAEQVSKILDAAEKFNVPLTTYDGDTAVTDRADDKYFNLEVKINRLSLRRVKSLRDELKYPVPKFLITGEPEYLSKVEIELKSELSDVSIFRSEPFFLEITPKGVDKGAALRWLADYLGIKRNETMACGDGYNDVSLLYEAGVGVAMENAQEPCKNAADYITLSNDDNGIEQALKKFAF